jgi:hypothetical protein
VIFSLASTVHVNKIFKNYEKQLIVISDEVCVPVMGLLDKKVDCVKRIDA